MSGFIVTPRQTDFEQITPEEAVSIIHECGITKVDYDEIADKLRTIAAGKASANDHFAGKQPNVSVGIVSGARIAFSLNGPYMAKGNLIDGEQVGGVQRRSHPLERHAISRADVHSATAERFVLFARRHHRRKLPLGTTGDADLPRNAAPCGRLG